MILSVKNIKKSYDDGGVKLEVLKGISFGVKKGSILTIKGPSGSGKSTLLSLLGTLDNPDSGDILINDINLNDCDDFSDIRNNHIGFIFQFHNLIPELNVVENISVPALISGKKVDQDFLDTLFKYFGLSNSLIILETIRTQLTGYLPMAVSAAKTIPLPPLVRVLTISFISARVGFGFLIILSRKFVAVYTGVL